jgi:predicted nuclease of predicted toxin-antitoxin system
MTTSNCTLTLGNVTNLKLFVFFVLLLLSSTGSFAQANTNSVVVTASTEISASNDAKMVITNDKDFASSAMEFAVWFMGSKKTSNITPSNGTFSKKQLINSGINTNSVLIRSFLKKVSTQEKGIA